MCAIRIDQSSHSHVWCALEKTFGDDAVGFGNGGEATLNGEDAVVDARNDFAHARPDAGLISKVSDVLAGFADDHTGFLGRDYGAEGEFLVGVVLLAARRAFALICLRSVGRV